MKDLHMSITGRVIITSAPPNPNGDLHLGHLAGPFLGADVLRRFLRQTGHDVTHVGYSDAHSSYIPRRAHELGRTPRETAHVFGERMVETLGMAGMRPDYFTHPLREPLHDETVRRFARELWDQGVFEVEELPAYWCEGCARYLYEAEMRGCCQFCSAPSDGFYCEECGRPQETAGLAEARCTMCRREPVVRSLRRIVFPLEKYREQLREYYADRSMRPRLRAYLDDMLSGPLPRTAISREAGYGIPVPVDGWDGHILDTWFCGIWGYVAATVAHGAALGDAERPLRVWHDPDTKVYEFIGFDCSFSHAVLWPALFLARGGLTLPTQVVTNEFYRLEGDKFSTSRGHAIWGNQFLRQVPADQLRFYLCLTGPERKQTNFFAKDFAVVSRQVMVDGLQRWLDIVFGLVADTCGGVVPEADPRTDGPVALAAAALPSRVRAALHPDDFSPQAAAAALRDATEVFIAGLGDRTPDGADLVTHLEAAAVLAAVAAPVMPAFAEQVWTALGNEFADPLHRTIEWPEPGRRLVPAGRRVGGVPTMFHPVAG
jgi:methionyl-tRNA synthetase